MTKEDLARAVSAKTGMTGIEADNAVSVVFGCVSELVAEKGGLILRGFGRFVTRDNAERAGLNPKTGEAAIIPARRVVSFKAGKAFKQLVNQGVNE